MEYKVIVETNRESHFIAGKILKYHALVLEIVRRKGFPIEEFRRYLKDKGVELTYQKLNNFLNGRFTDNDLCDHLIGYYHYIKEFGFYESK